MQKQLAESQKMDALGQLTGGVAHDFNNLLMSITGGTRLIRRHADDPRVIAAAETIEANIRRGAALTRQLLTFARRQQVHPILISVREAVAAVGEVLKTGLGRTIQCAVNIPDGIWPVYADPAELETALINLALNARDAMPDGGEVTISAENRRVEQEDFPAEHVCITVADTGAGIPDDVIAKVFDPFFTTKPIGKGTGLGLSQVHGFANQAGGTVEIASRLGEGTQVTLCLPRGEGRSAEVEARDITAGAGTVLLVEDNPEVASSSALLLEELGYRVKRVADAEAALYEIEHLHERIDVVFSDIVMPGKMDGLGLARHLRKINPTIPVVLATGYSDAARKSGVEFPILRKPYELHELSRALELARSR
jgi:CheY-like chemotaxis protein/anti-sigma regulatory factor (Ser/Thr protein kinase)